MRGQNSRHSLAELTAENTRLALSAHLSAQAEAGAEYQDAADAVCAALSVEWTMDNRYPTVAVEAIRVLREELKLNAAMLARQCDLAREAEADAEMLRGLLAGRGREVSALRAELAREKMRAASRGSKR